MPWPPSRRCRRSRSPPAARPLPAPRRSPPSSLALDPWHEASGLAVVVVGGLQVRGLVIATGVEPKLDVGDRSRALDTHVGLRRVVHPHADLRVVGEALHEAAGAPDRVVDEVVERLAVGRVGEIEVEADVGALAGPGLVREAGELAGQLPGDGARADDRRLGRVAVLVDGDGELDLALADPAA